VPGGDKVSPFGVDPGAQHASLPVVGRVSSFIEAATGGQWRVTGIEREDGVIVLETSTPEGTRHLQLTAAGASAAAYRVVGDVAVSYRPTAAPASREFLATLDRVLPRAERLFSRLVHVGAVAATARPTVVSEPVPPTQPDLSNHVFALQASGFTVLRSLVDRDRVAALGDLADRAMAETRRQLDRGAVIPDSVFDRQFQLGTRGLYMWGDACMQLLESHTIEQLCEAVIGAHKLIDVVLFVSHPAAGNDARASEGWHRDVAPVIAEPYRAQYLWFIVPIDPFAADNGSTWVVPGSHRLADTSVPPPPQNPSGADRYPSRMQMILDAGDALVLDPAALHSRGHNGTSRPRRMLNVMVCRRDAPLQWLWDFAGQRVRDTASPRVRDLLGGSLPAEERASFAAGLEHVTHLQRNHALRTPAWPALPPDWQA
jgi:ectoine hydroxylase-related dioxygenase (phytanoyl-CoA dioxygenase family)